MIRMIGRKMGLTMERIWFWNGDAPISSKSDIVRYLRVFPHQAERLKGCADTAYTLMSDLQLTEEELLQQMNKNYRYEIRRAAKEEVNLYSYDAAALLAQPDVMQAFEQTYMNFCDALQNEDLKKDFDRTKIASYIEHDCILVTRAQFPGTSGDVFHLYVADGETAVLCYSASDFRGAAVDRAAAGRINKLLHWKDMQQLKQAGYRLYDWGNVSSFTEYNGIDTFKAGFGGKQETLKNVFVGNTFPGKAAVTALRLYTTLRGGCL